MRDARHVHATDATGAKNNDGTVAVDPAHRQHEGQDAEDHGDGAVQHAPGAGLGEQRRQQARAQALRGQPQAAGGDHAGGERHAGIAEVLGNRADHHHVQPEMRVDQRETDRGHQYGTAAAVIAVSLAHAAATGNRTARRLHRIPGQERHAGPQHGGGQPRQRRGERAQAGDAGEDEDGIDGRAE
ncbi:hypothetical protein G6F22_017948 [Rhizopus arrhizus]|nr:hypothetical protein G6F22_017948 [Rhizopus arrhizus]